MDELLPEEFDVIIIGTGLSESVLSGALSRINQKVLHLDANDYYGGIWASFNIKAFDDFMNYKDEAAPENSFDIEKLLESGEKFLPITRRSCIADRKSICNLSKTVNVPTKITNTDGNATIEVETKSTLENENAKQIDEVDCAASNNELESSTALKSDESSTKDAKLEQSSENTDAVLVADCEQSSDGAETLPISDLSLQSKTEETKIDDEIQQDASPPPVSPYEEFYNLWRYFNIDLGFKVLFSRGSLVELLIQSNVSRYLEFRNISRLLTLMENNLQPVPCTRADVFKSKFVSVVQKRILMRILTTCANYEQHPEIENDYKNKRFVDFLVGNKLCKEAQHFIIHSIAMVTDDVLTMEGVCATQKFLQSLGRYGNSAFLFPTYGVGETPQAFSRLSAVFGGLFCLRRFALGLIIDQQSGQCKGIVDSTGQKISCRHVIVDEANAPDIAQKEFEAYISRAVYVTDRSLLSSTTEHASLITLPATENYKSIRLLEVGPAASVCPSHHYLLHATTNSTSSASGIQSPNEVYDAIEKLLFAHDSDKDLSKDPEPSSSESGDAERGETRSKPRLRWKAYFNVLERGLDRGKVAGNVHIMNGPGDELGFDSAIAEARKVFEVICPEEEFLPRAPEPEEIIFNDEGYNTEKNGSSSSDSPEDQNGDYGEREEVLRNEGSSTGEREEVLQNEGSSTGEREEVLQNEGSSTENTVPTTQAESSESNTEGTSSAQPT